TDTGATTGRGAFARISLVNSLLVAYHGYAPYTWRSKVSTPDEYRLSRTCRILADIELSSSLIQSRFTSTNRPRCHSSPACSTYPLRLRDSRALCSVKEYGPYLYGTKS